VSLLIVLKGLIMEGVCRCWCYSLFVLAAAKAAAAREAFRPALFTCRSCVFVLSLISGAVLHFYTQLG
jgi:hypothetical protein